MQGKNCEGINISPAGFVYINRMYTLVSTRILQRNCLFNPSDVTVQTQRYLDAYKSKVTF